MTEYKIIGKLATMNLIKKIYPVNINRNTIVASFNKFNTIMNDGGHFTEYNVANILCKNVNSKLTNNYKNCKTSKIKNNKRDESVGSCKLSRHMKITQIFSPNINSLTVNTLKMLKNMDINPSILPYSLPVNNINNGKLLVKNANNIEDV